LLYHGGDICRFETSLPEECCWTSQIPGYDYDFRYYWDLASLSDVHTHSNTDFPEFTPPDINTRSDSTILLPVSCFFDPDLIAKRNPYSPLLQKPLSSAQLDRIGRPIKNASLPEFWIYVSLALLFLTETFVACCDCWVARSKKNSFAEIQNNRKKKVFPYMRVLGYFVLTVCLGVDIFWAWHIYNLRKWTRESGWMKNNSEDEWVSLSQLMPVFSLTSVVFTLLGGIKIGRRGFKISKDYNV
jgi:hypothetical protein